MTSTATADAQREPAPRVPGEPGVWVFIFGDVLIFTALFLTYAVYRGQEPDGFAASQSALSVPLGLTNTLVLLVSSLLIVRAVQASRRGAGTSAFRLTLGAIACGLVFSSIKSVEYTTEIHAGHTPAAEPFFFYYFLMTGLHWFHLVVGMIFLTVVAALVRRGPLPPRSRAFVEGGACFWHMVDLLWVVIFPLLYLTR